MAKQELKGFTETRVYFYNNNGYKIGKPRHFTFDTIDGVYYRDDVDDVYTQDIPNNGYLSATLKSDHCRVMVKLDR